MTKANLTLTLDAMRRRWVGVLVLSSTDHGLDKAGRHPRAVESIYQNSEDKMYYAWSGEHHRANTLEALDARLHSLRA